MNTGTIFLSQQNLLKQWKPLVIIFFTFFSSLNGQVTFSAGGLPSAIPDPGNLNITIAVSGLTGTVTTADEVQINVAIAHAWASDIVIGVTPPGGSEILIVNRIGGGVNIDMVSANVLSFRSNASGTVVVPGLNGIIPAGIYLPSGNSPVGNFSSLIGANRNGNWTLRVRDDDAIIQGSLASASISFFNTPSPVVLTCPTNTTEPSGQTQLAINSSFATWLSTVSGSGGCNGALSNNNVGAPPANGGSTTVTFTYTSDCAPLITTCNATFSVETGLYQNMQTGISYTLLQTAIDAAMPGQSIILLGNVSESNVTVNNSVTLEANGFTLTIPTGTLTIPSGKSLTWKEDTLIIGPGASIDNDGTLKNNGIINYQSGSGTFNNTGAYSGIGSFEGNFVNNGDVSPGN